MAGVSAEGHARAKDLLSGVVRDFQTSGFDLSSILRRCVEVCHLLNWSAWEARCRHELYGYPPTVQVPEYRHGRAVVVWAVGDSPYDQIRAAVAGGIDADDAEMEWFACREGIDQLRALARQGLKIKMGTRETRRLARLGERVTVEKVWYAPPQEYDRIAAGVEQHIHDFALRGEQWVTNNTLQASPQPVDPAAADRAARIRTYLEGINMARQPPVMITESLAGFRRDHPDPAKVAFLMMQFGTTKLHGEFVEAIRSTGRKHGVTVLRADDKEYHDDLFWNVATYMHGCSFGIAVFERLVREDFNPNVSLEVGYMLALGKQVCLLKDTTLDALNADLVGRLYRSFDTQDAKNSIPRELEKWMVDRGLIGASAG